MGNEFNPNLNIDDPLAEVIEAENTLREFGAASSAMEFQAEQAEGQTEAAHQVEEAHSLTETEQLLQDRIAELEAQLASHKAATAAGATQATITSTGVNDDCPEIVDPEPLDAEAVEDEDGEPADDDAEVEPTDIVQPEDDTEVDWGALDDYLEGGDDAEPEPQGPQAPQVPQQPQVPMVTLQHRIPRPGSSAWEPAKEDVINIQVPKAEIFANPAQPYTVTEENITLPEGITGNYQVASTRAMLSENTVYVNWRLNSPTRPSGLFF